MDRQKQRRPVILAFFLMLALGSLTSQQTKSSSSTGAQAISAKPTQSQSALRAIVLSGRLEDLRWPDFSDYRVHVDNFYRPSGYAPAWLSDGKTTPRAREVLDVLLQADGEGLHAEDYDGLRWSDRLSHLEAGGTPADKARFDVALTVCTMRYVSDVRIGRINPQHLKFGFDIKHKKLDLPQFVKQLLTEGTDVKLELAAIEPPFSEYKETRAALLTYMRLAKEDDGEKLPPPKGMVFRGGPYDGLGRLTRLLRLLGDLPESAVVPANPQIYEGALPEAVQRFQARHGLRPDGYLTPETVEQLNVPLTYRVEQIRLALERYRWLRYDFTEPPIVVNIPEFPLYALNREGRAALAMGVNVGDAYNFQTPIFENSIKYLVFRPYWNVPPKILRDEVVPDTEEDRNYIAENNMEVLTPAGHVVTGGRIGDSVLQQLRAGKLTVRQKPGPENALGLLKIIFPNEHHVYLHDTPASVDMFGEPERARSHGCIHLQEPAKLAAWLLRDKPDWTLERVESAMHEGRDNFTVNLAKPVPVLIVYVTAVWHKPGEIHFYRDIYGHDAELEKALAKGYPYPI